MDVYASQKIKCTVKTVGSLILLMFYSSLIDFYYIAPYIHNTLSQLKFLVKSKSVNAKLIQKIFIDINTMMLDTMVFFNGFNRAVIKDVKKHLSGDSILNERMFLNLSGAVNSNEIIKMCRDYSGSQTYTEVIKNIKPKVKSDVKVREPKQYGDDVKLEKNEGGLIKFLSYKKAAKRNIFLGKEMNIKEFIEYQDDYIKNVEKMKIIEDEGKDNISDVFNFINNVTNTDKDNEAKIKELSFWTENDENKDKNDNKNAGEVELTFGFDFDFDESTNKDEKEGEKKDKKKNVEDIFDFGNEQPKSKDNKVDKKEEKKIDLFDFSNDNAKKETKTEIVKPKKDEKNNQMNKKNENNNKDIDQFFQFDSNQKSKNEIKKNNNNNNTNTNTNSNNNNNNQNQNQVFDFFDFNKQNKNNQSNIKNQDIKNNPNQKKINQNQNNVNQNNQNNNIMKNQNNQSQNAFNFNKNQFNNLPQQGNQINNNLKNQSNINANNSNKQFNNSTFNFDNFKNMNNNISNNNNNNSTLKGFNNMNNSNNNNVNKPFNFANNSTNNNNNQFSKNVNPTNNKNDNLSNLLANFNFPNAQNNNNNTSMVQFIPSFPSNNNNNNNTNNNFNFNFNAQVSNNAFNSNNLALFSSSGINNNSNFNFSGFGNNNMLAQFAKEPEIFVELKEQVCFFYHFTTGNKIVNATSKGYLGLMTESNTIKNKDFDILFKTEKIRDQQYIQNNFDQKMKKTNDFNYKLHLDNVQKNETLLNYIINPNILAQNRILEPLIGGENNVLRYKFMYNNNIKKEVLKIELNILYKNVIQNGNMNKSDGKITTNKNNQIIVEYNNKINEGYIEFPLNINVFALVGKITIIVHLKEDVISEMNVEIKDNYQKVLKIKKEAQISYEFS